MAVQKLPKEIQLLFCASQLYSYKRAIEELVYNSLDADSTSIAIRVNIEENSIQIIDNGHGISKNDFNLLGQRHATSKCVDLATLKSAPNKYGFRGLALASIIENSRSVKITSRCSDSEDTSVKNFYKGKEEKVCEVSQRPSKGTTVDIKGFLYNLNIQKKSIQSLNELNEIKSFLEQLSLVHNNISVSLRDDAKNEIIFKLHKNRDIYQTLSSVFDVTKQDLEELRIEKGEYKVTAYVGKRDKETSEKRWIYLNGKLLQNSKINKIVNDSLSRALKLNLQTKKKVKSKNPYNQEEDLTRSGIPFYFIFITCPYYDYDLNVTSKQTVVEFRSWDQISKILEKLVKFYVGDLSVQETKTKRKSIKNIDNVENTRDVVKKIMERILGSNKRKIGVSQMQRGVKGKKTKRKLKNQTTKFSLKIISPKNKNQDHANIDTDLVECHVNYPREEQKNTEVEHNDKNKIKSKTVQIENQTINNAHQPKIITVAKNKNKAILTNIIGKSERNNNKILNTNIIDKKSAAKKTRSGNPKLRQEHKKSDKLTVCSKKALKPKPKRVAPKSLTEKGAKVDVLLKKFNDDPTGSVRKRCNQLSKKVDEIIRDKKKRKRKVFVNETVEYRNVVKDNKKYSIRRKIGEIVIHNYIPKPIGTRQSSYDGRIWNNLKINPQKEKEKISTYDLIKTVLTTEETKNIYTESVSTDMESLHNNNENYVSHKSKVIKTVAATPPVAAVPKLTYESHNYEQYINRVSHELYLRSYDNEINYADENKTDGNVRFITTQSRDNFLIPRVKDVTRHKKVKPYSKNFRMNKNFIRNCNQSMSYRCNYSIDFSNSNENTENFHIENLKTKSVTEPIGSGTYTLHQNETNLYENDYSLKYGSTYTIINETVQDSDEIEFCSGPQNIYSSIISTGERELANKKNYVNKTLDNRNYCKQNYISSFPKKDSIENDQYLETEETSERRNMNVVFVSKTQEPGPIDNSLTLPEDLLPLEVCETVLSGEYYEESKTFERINDSLFDHDFEIGSSVCGRNAYSQQNFPDAMELDNFNESPINLEDVESRHFSQIPNPVAKLMNNEIVGSQGGDTIKSYGNENKNKKISENKFDFQDRLRFVPKGMSQIFQNCQTKNLHPFNFEQDYFEEMIYNKFADVVRGIAKIYEPEVQNVKELTTKAVDKVKTRLNKDHASLVFDGNNLKNATALAQIDSKFIAAKMSGRTHKSYELVEYLILFDQHAVHERIRLETNLTDYLKNDRWKTASLDEFTIKLSRDETLYLHNYKDKFNQLGLEWTMLDNGEVSIKAIPEAILGKNPRQVEIVVKSVKNLILEEINAIKTQSGCISLYPKAIMELIFSEACRYAIKFGDKLSLNECAELLNSLAECKTPFQCAHGRPVMAVLMEVRSETRKYKANIASVSSWCRRRHK